MKRMGILVASIFAMSGCTTNMVKLGVYKNKAQLIGLDGTVYPGTILVNDFTNDGDIEFENSPYGKLSGKWTGTSVVSAVAKSVSSDAPVVADTINRRAYSGKTFLIANNKAVLNCDFKANIEGDGLLGLPVVIGDGVCTDEHKNAIPIQFFKS